MSEARSTSAGVGLYGATFLVLLALKLAEIGPVARWSWVWVTAPLWIPAVMAALVLTGMALRLAIRAAARRVRKHRSRGT